MLVFGKDECGQQSKSNYGKSIWYEYVYPMFGLTRAKFSVLLNEVLLRKFELPYYVCFPFFAIISEYIHAAILQFYFQFGCSPCRIGSQPAFHIVTHIDLSIFWTLMILKDVPLAYTNV